MYISIIETCDPHPPCYLKMHIINCSLIILVCIYRFRMIRLLRYCINCCEKNSLKSVLVCPIVDKWQEGVVDRFGVYIWQHQSVSVGFFHLCVEHLALCLVLTWPQGHSLPMDVRLSASFSLDPGVVPIYLSIAVSRTTQTDKCLLLNSKSRK